MHCIKKSQEMRLIKKKFKNNLYNEKLNFCNHAIN